MSRTKTISYPLSYARILARNLGLFRRGAAFRERRPCYAQGMGNVEDVRKALEEFVAPSLVEVKTQVAGLHAELANFKADSKSDLLATEARLMKAIESAKTEVLLMVRVSDLSARNAELEAKLAEITKREGQSQ